MKNLYIRPISECDIDPLATAVQNAYAQDRRETYEKYVIEQNAGTREVRVAQLDNQLAGYLTVLWKSDYAPFERDGVPEINDFNVWPSFRRQGIGTSLMDDAESLIRQRSPEAGIGVGMYADYGPAQRLYVLRGYVPDGLGLTYETQPIAPGKSVVVDDALVLFFRKQLSTSN